MFCLGDTGSIEFGAECEESQRRDSQPIDNGNNSKLKVCFVNIIFILHFVKNHG